MFADPGEYFSRWLQAPLLLGGMSPIECLAAMDKHPIARDDRYSCDSFMPFRRAHEHEHRTRIYGECQDTWYLFVLREDEANVCAPVFLESSLELHTDHGIEPFRVQADNSALVCESFQEFLWVGVAHQIVSALECGQSLATDVCGIAFDDEISLDESFTPLTDIPVCLGFSVSPTTICCPGLGAAFIDSDSRKRFVREYDVDIDEWWR